MRWHQIRFGIALCAVTLLGCTEPQPGAGDLRWEVPGEVGTQPLIVDSLVVVAFRDGRLTAFKRASGAVVWQRRFRGPMTGDRLLRSGEVLIVPEYELHGVNVRTGALLWTYAGPGGSAGINVPAMADGLLFAADYQPGRAAAVEVATGAVRWGVDLDAALFTPTVANDLVLYPTRGRLGPDGQGPLGAGHLVALDRVTGAERWRYAIPDSAGFTASGGTTNGGVVVGDRVILGTRASRAVALRLTDGAVLWEQASGTPYGAAYSHEPVLFGGSAALIRGDGVLEARSITDGSLVWSTEVSSTDTSFPALCEPYLCLSFGRVRVVDQTGRIVWAYGGASAGVTFLSTPAIDEDGVMYIGAVRGLSDTWFQVFKPPIAIGATR